MIEDAEGEVTRSRWMADHRHFSAARQERCLDRAVILVRTVAQGEVHDTGQRSSHLDNTAVLLQIDHRGACGHVLADALGGTDEAVVLDQTDILPTVRVIRDEVLEQVDTMLETSTGIEGYLTHTGNHATVSGSSNCTRTKQDKGLRRDVLTQDAGYA